MAFLLNTFTFGVNTKLTDNVQTYTTDYTIAYRTNVEFFTEQYTVRYTSTSLVQTTNRYNIVYDSLYGDIVNTYTFRYYSGRESEYVDTRYTLKYTSPTIEQTINTYSVLYTTTGPSSVQYRHVYKMKYDTQGVNEVSTTYSMRYSLEYFKERSDKYYIRYTSETPFMYDTKSVLLRNQNKTSVLFCLKGRQEALDEILFVFSNLPRYQLVEFGTELERPNIKILDTDSVIGYNLFGEQFNPTSRPTCYVVIEGIEEINSVSLDLYDKVTLEKRNENKSFFFNLDSTEFYSNPVKIANVNYQMVNYSSDYYNYKYLNFVEKSVTPLFKVYSNCCFSNKITDTSSGSACSPL